MANAVPYAAGQRDKEDNEVGQPHPSMNVPPTIAAAGIIIGMSLGLVSGLFPSVFAYSATITELLRRA